MKANYYFAVLATVALAPLRDAVASPSDSATVVLASNDQVLAAWQGNVQDGGSPALATSEAGDTTITWHGNVTADGYADQSRGNATVTPMRSGHFYRLQFQSDWRATTPLGDTSYAVTSVNNSNDPSILHHSTQINSLQVGRIGNGYQMAIGNVIAGFSTLGANTGLIGALAQRQFGNNSITMTAGVITSSWEDLTREVPRVQYMRDVYAAKFDHTFTDSLQGYVTAGTYADQKTGIASSSTASLPPAWDHAFTAGINYQRGPFLLQGETGVSRWQQSGDQAHDDSAHVVDANWSHGAVMLRGGWHDVGRFYSAPSAMTTPGIEDTYAGGTWNAAPWLVLSTDAHHSQNRNATLAFAAAKSDSLLSSVNFLLDSWLQGLGFMLQRQVSHGKNADDSRNDNDSGSATLSYNNAAWNHSLSYTRTTIRNDGASAANGATTVWAYTIARNWLGAAPVPTIAAWTLTTTLSVSLQRQDTQSGGRADSKAYTLGVSAQDTHDDALNISYVYRTFIQNATLTDMALTGIQFDASHGFRNGVTLKMFANDTRNAAQDINQQYSERQAGLELSYRY